MAVVADVFELAALRLTSGEGRSIELYLRVRPYELGGQTYTVEPAPLPVRLDVSRTTHEGYALLLRFDATLVGPCTRCLEEARSNVSVQAREVTQPGGGEELDSPYVEHGELDLAAWGRDALALSLPASILCRPDCTGLCPVCGEDLNLAGTEHRHDREPDSRWAKLSEIRFD